LDLTAGAAFEFHGFGVDGREAMRLWKGQALGNDYLLLEADEAPAAAVVRALCDRHRGIGSDGLLVAGRGGGAGEVASLRIFNPDGGEAEKSGNGLRIFGAWLHHRGRVGEETFRVGLGAESVEMQVEAVRSGGTRVVRVEMGPASFRAGDVGYAGANPNDEVMGDPVAVGDQHVAFHLVSVGNPHCVLFPDPLDPAALRRLGPAIQALPAFTRGVNVQLARVAGPAALDAWIWERGAGETLASGSSACAVVAAALRSGRLTGRRVEVRMPGGVVEVEVDDAWRLRLTGPAQILYEATLAEGVVGAWAQEQAG
jgi:diaminopimelate epimerase